ncbi:MAG: zf-HC2 domain-containing protein [Candidatus Eisenbacteria bacterium]
MSHAHVSDDRLLGYVLGDVVRNERAEIDAHVRDCEACRARLSPLTGLVQTYCAAPPPEAPIGVLVDLLEKQSRTRPRPRPSVFRGWRPTFATTFVAATFVFAIGLWIGRHSVSSGGVTPFSTEVTPLSRTPRAAETESGRAFPVPPEIPFETAPPLEPVLHVPDGSAWAPSSPSSRSHRTARPESWVNQDSL